MRKWLILLSALFGTTASGAPAWTWVDANGTVHFSDTPVPGARQIELSGAQGFVSSAQPAQAPAPRRGAAPDSRAIYQAIDIVTPAEQETLRNIGSELTVQARTQPALQPGHRYDWVLDGQRRNVNTTNASVTLPDVFRGTHTLQIVVIDVNGVEVARSPTRTFHVQQTSVLNPNSRQRAGGN